MTFAVRLSQYIERTECVKRIQCATKNSRNYSAGNGRSKAILKDLESAYQCAGDSPDRGA
jgi:hypothetical protein